jgi:hypothetical protein
MNKIGFIVFLLTINLNAQEVLTFQEKIDLISRSYDIDYGGDYYEHWNECPELKCHDCDEGQKIDSCWRFGTLGYYEGGPITYPFDGDLIFDFYYFPSKNMIAQNDSLFRFYENNWYNNHDFPLLFELKCLGYKAPYKIWEYKDDAITIRVSCVMNESAWGWSLYETQIMNSKNDPLLGPLTVTRKHYH